MGIDNETMFDVSIDMPQTFNKPVVKLQYSEVTFEVTKKGVTKQILKGINGTCEPGRLLAIMGASGAGKTTLLDILAGVSYGGAVGGTILVNGQPRQRKQFLKLSCYVQQRDVLLATATVREAITTSALLKLPPSMTKQQKLQRVDTVLKELDLEPCANVMIGDETIGIKGCSGGQKRRVSVGVELVKDPSLIFLDEPTSGLDSETASTLMQTLVDLARKGRTVVCTIHQPNSDITSKFDDFLLLARGMEMYNGPWLQSMDYFTQQGFSCPNYTNPTDFYLSLVKDEATSTTLAQSFAKHRHHIEAPPTAEEEHAIAPEETAKVAKTSMTYQTGVLAVRAFKSWLRNPQMFIAELVQYIFVALLVGLMYLQVPDTVAAGSFDRVSAVWFSLAILSFTPSYTSCVVWDKERLLLKRELTGAQYKASSYYLAKTITMIPFEILLTVLYVSISYFMIGFQANAAKFFIALGIMIMFMLTSETIGQLVGILCRQVTTSVLVLTIVLLLLLSFSGFLTAELKPYLVWLQKASYLTYSLVALLQNEFSGLTLYTENGTPVDAMGTLPPAVNNGLSIEVNIVIVAAQMIGWRLLTWLVLVICARFRYL